MPKKNPFEDLDSDYKDAVAGSEPSEIRLRIADLQLYIMELKKQKKNDPDLKKKKARADDLSAKYKVAYSLNDLKLQLFPTEKLTPVLKSEVADLALAQMDVEAQKRGDADLQDALDTLKFANGDYSEKIGGAKLRIKYCRQVLSDKNAI